MLSAADVQIIAIPTVCCVMVILMMITVTVVSGIIFSIRRMRHQKTATQ